MNAPALRPYQSGAIARVDAAFAAGRRAVVVVAPTGSGKTIIAGGLIQQAAAAGKRVLFIAPRRELINQASNKLLDVGVKHGIILAGDRRHDIYAGVQVASLDTLRSRADRLKLAPDLIFADECHLYVTDKRKRLLDRWPDALRIGLTATPSRKDGRGLRVLFDTLIEVASVAELTRLGFLVPARYFSIAEPDMSRVAIVAGDYNLRAAAYVMAPLLGDIVETWLQRAGGRRTAVFCLSVAHSISLCAFFAQAGVKAEQVDGGTPLELRAAIFRRFESGETQVLTNCLVASYGFDLPALDCVVLARPTKSLVMYLQMVGRGLRPSPGKKDCLVLDHSGCIHEFGFASDDRQWSLDGHADLEDTRRAREASEGTEVTCPACQCVYCGGRTCPECGFYIRPAGKEILTVDGELVEVGGHLDQDDQDRLAFYLQLRGYAQESGYKPAWAAHKFKDMHGAFPPWIWNDAPAATPSLATRRWIKSRQIAWLKSRGAAAT